MSDIVALPDLAELFCIEPKTVREWIKAGLPTIERGRPGRGSHQTRLSLRAVVAWYFSERSDRLEAERQRARRDAEMADKLALQNATSRRELAPVLVMEQELAALFADMRNNALGIGSKLSPQLVGLTTAEICARIDGAMRTLLIEIVEYKPGRRRK